MVGKQLPSSQGGNPPKKRRKKGGLKTFVQDGSWHVTGTLRVNGRSVRVRKTLGLPAERPEHEAEAARVKLETEIIEQAVYGIKPSRPFASVALEWLKSKQPGACDIRQAQKLGKFFGTTIVRDITTADIARFTAVELATCKPSTVNRYYNTLRAILGFGVRMGYADNVPHIERPKVKRTSLSKILLIGELEAFLEEAAPHAAAIMALMMVTGCRVSEAVYLEIKDVILAKGRERVIFRDTKNGDTYGAPLHGFAVPYIKDAIGGRKSGPVFLTHKGKPYVDRENQYGGQIKTAFRVARKRVVARLLEAGEHERAEIVSQATPHWLRHSFASHMMAQGESVKTIMDAGRWKTATLVIQTYGHLAPDATRDAVSKLPFGKIGRDKAGDDKADAKKKDGSSD